jgi:hypothetical protein
MIGLPYPPVRGRDPYMLGGAAPTPPSDEKA